MKSKIDSLQIVELKLGNDTKLGGTLKSLRTVTNAFAPETCARHVMIFFDILWPNNFKKHYNKAKSLAKESQHLVGAEAYAFLLSWIVGGEYRFAKLNSKISMFNDNHTLGKFKSKWADFLHQDQNAVQEPTQEKKHSAKEEQTKMAHLKHDFIQTIEILLRDAHEIRKRIESKQYGRDKELRYNLDVVISNIIYSRLNNLPVLYEQMHSYDYKALLNAFVEGEANKLNGQLQKAVSESANSKINEKLMFYRKQLLLFRPIDGEVEKAVAGEILSRVNGGLV